jgi:glycosyltransferase involved in cell wall biosynthesis
MMKICHVVPSLQEQHGGPSKSVRALCEALAGTENEVEVLTTAPDAPAAGSEIRVGRMILRTFRRDWPDRLCRSRGLLRALSETDANVIHHHALWLRTLHYSHSTAAAKSVPLVISPRGMMSTWAWNHHRIRKQISRRVIHPGALEQASAWHATSAEEAHEISALGFEQPICVAPNGVTIPSTAEQDGCRRFWSELCPAVSQRRTALYYGRFHQKKRVIELIDAWIEHAPADWLLLMVGLPQDYTPQLIEEYVRRMSAAGRVQAFSGAGRPPPYGVASLFVLASHNENFGLVIAEALANGVPAVVTNTTPWSGLNQNERGWCVPWQDFPAAIRAATAESPDQLAARGKKSKAWVAEEFSWDKEARKLAAFYDQLPR